ncbi:MAG: hypothetical protein ACYC27_11865 [Armatimonadota bacterium]
MNNSGRQYLHRGILALILILVMGSIAVQVNPAVQSGTPVTSSSSLRSDYFTSDARVMLFVPDQGQWMLTKFRQTKPGSEFYFNNSLYRAVDSETALFVPKIDAGKLYEADQQYSQNSRKPLPGDAVQVLDKDIRFVEHSVLSTVQPGTIIRFQGRAYKIKADRSLANTEMVFSSDILNLQRIEITASGFRHVQDRHMVGGTMTAGKSIFFPTEDVKSLIKCAQLTTPEEQDNGLFKRVFDAGRFIGAETNGKHTSTYLVITMKSGNLVTAYPVRP